MIVLLDSGSEREEVLILPGSTCPPAYTTSVSKVLIPNTFSTTVSPISPTVSRISPPKFLKHEALNPTLTVDSKSNYVEFACEVAETSLLNDSGFAIGDDITGLETDEEFEIVQTEKHNLLDTRVGIVQNEKHKLVDIEVKDAKINKSRIRKPHRPCYFCKKKPPK